MTPPPNPANVLDGRTPAERDGAETAGLDRFDGPPFDDPTEIPVVLDCAEAAELGPDRLVDHIEATHHALLRDELPRLETLAADVALMQARRHPELLDVQRLVGDLRGLLEPHLHEEEVLLFPMVRRLSEAVADGKTVPEVRRSVLSSAVPAMVREHADVRAVLARIRELTGGFKAPSGASDDHRSLFEGLALVERDLDRHVDEEHDLLTPAVTALLDQA